MLQFPKARDQEFQQLLKYVSISKDDTIADMPAGSCYLKNYIDNDIYFLDPTQEFLDNCPDTCTTIKTSLDDTKIESSFFNTIFSLAGAHHIKDKDAFYAEVHRLLKPKGKFIYADVLANSKEDKFLNTFVNEYNSLGHTGVFLDATVKISLQTIGFEVKELEYINYHWSFTTEEDMIKYIKSLFGLDLASDAIILNAIDDILKYTKKDGLIQMNWGLFFISTTKASSINIFTS